MKEEFMKQQELNNQLNNNEMTKKTMQEKLRKQPEPVVETRKEALRRLYKQNGLTEEDIYKDKRGFVIITRTGIDKIVSRNNITVAYEVINMDVEKCICITDTQWLIIENNIYNTSLPSRTIEDIIERLNDLTQLEAEEIITTINENTHERDTRKQWERMFKDGMFKHRDL